MSCNSRTFRLLPNLLLLVIPFRWVSAGLTVEVVPAATGTQLVRASIPLPRNLLTDNQEFVASGGGRQWDVSTRRLGDYPATNSRPPSVRRVMVTWVQDFPSLDPVHIELLPVDRRAPKVRNEFAEVSLENDRISVQLAPLASTPDQKVHARWISDVKFQSPPKIEIVESNADFEWRRYHYEDVLFPTILEVRSDRLGTTTLRGHVQSRDEQRTRAPDLGWEISSSIAGGVINTPKVGQSIQPQPAELPFTSGDPLSVVMNNSQLRVEFPTAASLRRGVLRTTQTPYSTTIQYFRCLSSERVPMQWMSWRTAEVVIQPAPLAKLTATLEYPHTVRVDAKVWDEAYGIGRQNDPVGFPILQECLDFHREAMTRSTAIGDDWGNVTSFGEGSLVGGSFGMNRLNHCRPLFEEGYRTADRRLVEAGLLWCDNFHDLSIWWGEKGYGGTRYNNIVAQNQTPPDNDQNFMWRSNSAVDFCTKGYDSFLLAYEQTGDPRMLAALNGQTKFASEFVHIQHQTRNVGDVRDFMYLYRRTGQYLDQSLRLFRELREFLSTDDLFSQSGAPLETAIPFIESDDTGYKHPFAKPYIIGYALSGLPELAAVNPEEPKLQATIVAAARFLCESQDPIGAWRYPHAKSSGIIGGQALEHAWQISQADRFLGPDPQRLDAIERMLRQRILGWQKTGKIFGGLQGWEYAQGKAKQSADIEALYSSPDQRESLRDYTEGGIGFGGSPPEGIVYFPELLNYYLRHRSAMRLLEPPVAGQPLETILGRVAPIPRSKIDTSFQTPGVQNNLPVFREHALNRLHFPLSWNSGRFTDFASWRSAARERVKAALLSFAPPKQFQPVVIAEEDRGTHWARKVVFNVSADSRILALQTIPKGDGPFPAVLLLHDHGAKFDIGKEKVIRPFDIPDEKLKSAEEWVSKYYGGRFLGDVLAERGYVCFATDMLNWSDRGGAGYENQQSLASNLLHLGMSHAGLIAHEDLQAAEFLAQQPKVDANRIAAMGLSVGCFRTWQLAALSDRIAAGAAICWMGTTKELMVSGNNQTKGQSAFVMTHPALSNDLDYPDVASIACPKPMLFYNGIKDGLFPLEGVQNAYRSMRAVWDSQQAGDKLVTRLWDVGHLFDATMQDEAFRWLDSQLKVKTPSATSAAEGVSK